MTVTTERAKAPAAEAGDRARKQEAPNANKTRWMLWMPNTLLAQLEEESERTGQPRAAVVRDASEAVMALPAEERDAFAEEASRRGIPVSEVYRTALSRHGTRLRRAQSKED